MAPYFCRFSGRALRSPSSILSRPASPLSSLPPELDVPLPLGLDRVDVPVVGVSARGVAELAAGSPVTAPRPLGAPPCANADPANNITAPITANPAFMCALPVFEANSTTGGPFRKR